ncbi:MAG TPA: magnesium/cobalt transporter CorA [bacterium]|nr:magnesium/cobalt transporter CorA [bacterium]
MGRLRKKRAGKEGLPPGTLVHIGRDRDFKVSMTVTRYDASGVMTTPAGTAEECLPGSDGRLTWVNVNGVHDAEIIKSLGKAFGIHALALEDIMDTDHSPKMDNYGNYIFIEMKSIDHAPKNCDGSKTVCEAEDPRDAVRGIGDIVSNQVCLILGPDYVISFLETEDDFWKPIRDRLSADTNTFATSGAGYLAYALMDLVVDHYFTSLERIDEEIYELEETTASAYDTTHLKLIQRLRREVIFVRRAAWPLREVISVLQKRETPLISPSTAVYLNDLYDHVVQIIDTTETFREVLSNIFDIFLTSNSNRINEIMKVLAVIATGILPLTLITGLYGMNFDFMPELHWRWGYPMAVVLMLTIGITMVIVFKKRRWI